jgi:hypothetical protein
MLFECSASLLFLSIFRKCLGRHYRHHKSYEATFQFLILAFIISKYFLSKDFLISEFGYKFRIEDPKDDTEQCIYSKELINSLYYNKRIC